MNKEILEQKIEEARKLCIYLETDLDIATEELEELEEQYELLGELK